MCCRSSSERETRGRWGKRGNAGVWRELSPTKRWFCGVLSSEYPTNPPPQVPNVGTILKNHIFTEIVIIGETRYHQAAQERPGLAR